jgi:septum site-determining protein MinC
VIQTPPTRAIRFRGRSFQALALCPEAPLDDWLKDVDAWLERSPGFFGGKPLVLDVTGRDCDAGALNDLVKAFAARDIRLLGVEGADAALASAELPPFLSAGKAANFIDMAPAVAAVPEPPAPQGLIIDAPVRSGQSIVHPEGDVTIIGSIGSGAEVIAGGSIHVYGALRGRALAGAYGNPRARIFCRKLECELLAIDGLYKVADEIDAEWRKKPAMAWLENDSVKIKSFD